MNSCIWLIVLFNSIFGWLLIFYSFKLIKNNILKNEKMIKQIILNYIVEEFGSENFLAKEIDSLDLEGEFAPFLDIRLIQLIQKIASQIPMGEFLVAGSLGQKLRSKIREEILKMLPELKEHFVSRFAEKFDIERFLKGKIDQYDFKRAMFLVEEKYSSQILKLKSFGASMGALTGLLEVLLIYLMC
jgi:hypothetical protein